MVPVREAETNRRRQPRDAPDEDDGMHGERWDAEHDRLGIFDDPDDGPLTGEVDLAELRDALARNGSGQATARRESRTSERREHRAAERRRRTRTVRSTVIAVLVMALILGGAVAGVVWWRNSTKSPTDWAGTGSTVVVVRVFNGDGLADVGQTLQGAGVVANAATFASVAAGNAKMKGLQPGFYKVHQHSSSQAVVAELTNPANRVGQLRIIPGQTLADLTAVSTTGQRTVKPGILTKIVEACVPTNGEKQCFSVDDLWKVAETDNLSDLGVVRWAVDDVRKAPDPRKRLEGLILPGDYDIAPGSTAEQALEAVVQASASEWNTTGIVAAAKGAGVTPYQLATIASLIQGEGLAPDMPKIARVIYNRLHVGMALKFDSTVNYALDKAQIATSDADRANPSPYNTYAHAGLPPTPIGSPGPDALDAAGEPATGSWLYFVAIDKNGHTCFSTTDAEHEACVAEARANGVFG